MSVWLYDAYWPFARSASVRTSKLEYSAELGGHGRLRMSVPATLAPADLAPDAILGVHRPPLPDWAGFVQEVEETAEGVLQVTALEYSAVLASRVTPQRARWPSGDAGLIAERLVAQAGARSPTGIEIARVATGALLSEGFEPRGQTVEQAIRALEESTGYEQAMAYEVGPRLRVRWSWLHRAGYDWRTQVHLVHLSDVGYVRTLAGRRGLTRAIGGSVEFADRPSAARVPGPGPVPFHNVARTVEPWPAKAVRTVTGVQERDIVDPRQGAASAVSRRTQAALQQPLVFEESLEFAMAIDAWPAGLGLGGVVGVRVPYARGGAGIVRPVRVLGYQADIAAGTVSVIVGVLDV